MTVPVCMYGCITYSRPPGGGAMLAVLQELLGTCQQYLAAGQQDSPVDVAGLQAELLTLRALVRSKDKAIQEMEAAGAAMR